MSGIQLCGLARSGSRARRATRPCRSSRRPAATSHAGGERREHRERLDRPGRRARHQLEQQRRAQRDTSTTVSQGTFIATPARWWRRRRCPPPRSCTRRSRGSAPSGSREPRLPNSEQASAMKRTQPSMARGSTTLRMVLRQREGGPHQHGVVELVEVEPVVRAAAAGHAEDARGLPTGRACAAATCAQPHRPRAREARVPTPRPMIAAPRPRSTATGPELAVVKTGERKLVTRRPGSWRGGATPIRPGRSRGRR